MQIKKPKTEDHCEEFIATNFPESSAEKISSIFSNLRQMEKIKFEPSRIQLGSLDFGFPDEVEVNPVFQPSRQESPEIIRKNDPVAKITHIAPVVRKPISRGRGVPIPRAPAPSVKNITSGITTLGLNRVLNPENSTLNPNCPAFSPPRNGFKFYLTNPPYIKSVSQGRVYLTVKVFNHMH